VSLINVCDPEFSLPYHVAGFPFGGGGDSRGQKGPADGGDSSGRMTGSSRTNGSHAANGLPPGALLPSDGSMVAAGSSVSSLQRKQGGCSAENGAIGAAAPRPLGGGGGSPLLSNTAMSVVDAHLLCMCAKLVYEEPGHIRAVLKQ